MVTFSRPVLTSTIKGSDRHVVDPGWRWPEGRYFQFDVEYVDLPTRLKADDDRVISNHIGWSPNPGDA